MSQNANTLSIYKCTGGGYERGWWTNFHGRYRVYKGARNTKKSYNMIGYEVIDKILSDPRRNVLILRNTFNTHRLSTFSTLCQIIDMPDMNNPYLSLRKWFKINNQDMIITYKPTGQMIIFKGMDDPQKIQGIRVPKGFLTDVYVEEAFEINDYEQWRKIDGSIRGKLPEGLFHQVTFCLNGWDIGHWIYDKFYKGKFEDDYAYLSTHDYQDYCDPDYLGDYGIGLYLHTSTYKINEFRDMDIYDKVMENLKNNAPEIYKVEALGMWGNTTEAVYPEMTPDLFRPRAEINNQRFSCYAIGIDTGLSNGEGVIKSGKDVKIRSATTMQLVGLTEDYGKLLCINEFYHSNEQEIIKKTEPQLMSDIIKTIIDWKELYASHWDLMKGQILVYVDCADIGFRQGLELEAKKQNLWNVAFLPSTKMKIQSRVDFIRLIMSFGEFLISEACPNLYRELKNARRGKNGKCREDIDDHAINANEYAWAPIINRLKRWKTFKER
jgi:phage terminase large subunit